MDLAVLKKKLQKADVRFDDGLKERELLVMRTGSACEVELCTKVTTRLLCATSVFFVSLW